MDNAANAVNSAAHATKIDKHPALGPVPDYPPVTGWRLTASKFSCFPQRYVFAIMALLAVANAYTMRVCLNYAITQMVPPASDKKGHRGCPDPNAIKSNTSGGLLRDDKVVKNTLFMWSEATQGLVLSSFYYGYVLTHIPGGWMSERYGGKWVLGIGIGFTALCTLLTPFVIRSFDWVGLFVLRIIIGLGEGPTMPGLMAMISKWAPKHERGKFGAIVFGGAQIGNIAGGWISGIVLSHQCWDNVFYIFGFLGVCWFILWTLICFSNPNTHLCITPQERHYLNTHVQALVFDKTKSLDPVPWKAVFRSVPLWALIIAAIGHDWGYFTMVTDLPKYMTDVLKFNIKKAGFLSTLPYICMWFASFVVGFVSDYLITHNYHTILTARKLYTTIAATGPGICILLASYSGCHEYLAVMWFVFAMTLMGAYYSGMKINVLDITPNYAGTTTALVNGIAAVSGIIAPYLIGLLTPTSSLDEWRVAFWVNCFMLVITNVVYIIWAQAEQQWWDDVRHHGYPATWTKGPLPVKRNRHVTTSEADMRLKQTAISGGPEANAPGPGTTSK